MMRTLVIALALAVCASAEAAKKRPRRSESPVRVQTTAPAVTGTAEADALAVLRAQTEKGPGTPPTDRGRDDEKGPGTLEVKRDRGSFRDEKGPGRVLAPVIDVFVGTRVFSRTLVFNDDLFGRYRPHRLPFSAAITASLEYFPGRHAGTGAYAHFGAIAGFDYALGVRTQDAATGSAAATQVFGGYGGLKARLPFARTGEAFASFTVGVAETSFGTAPLGPDGAYLMPLRYTSLRPAIGLRYSVSRFAGFATFSYFGVVHAGALVAEHFPRASVHGIGLDAGLAILLTSWLEARAAFEWRRMVADMHSKPGDSHVLGGFVDQTLGGTLGLALRL